MLPRKCETVDPVTNQPCPLNSWVVLGERSKYVDQQTLKLQVRQTAALSGWMHACNSFRGCGTWALGWLMVRLVD